MEKAKKAIETRNQYSDIVKELFFNDIKVSSNSMNKMSESHNNIILTPRDMLIEDVKRRKNLYPDNKAVYEHGNQYLDHVRRLNRNMTLEKRKELDEKRFQTIQNSMKTVKPPKSRKYLDQISRQFSQPKEFVQHKDLLKELQVKQDSRSKNAMIENIKNFDNHLDLKERSELFNNKNKNGDNSINDLYISNIQNKLSILDKHVK